MGADCPGAAALPVRPKAACAAERHAQRQIGRFCWQVLPGHTAVIAATIFFDRNCVRRDKPQAGPCQGPSRPPYDLVCVQILSGFSLHAGVAAEAHEGQELERLCRYIARPAISEKRLSISPQGKLRHQFKTPWKNGTTHVEFEPVE